MTDLVRLTRGVWRPAAHIGDLAARVSAMLTALPERTVLAGFTAALLHRLWLPPLDPVPPVEVILRADTELPASHAGSRRPEIRGRRRLLAPDEVVWIGGVPVTSLERTWLDLAESLRMPDLVAAGDCALRAGAVPEQMAVVLARARRRRGVRRARAALPLLDRRSRSRPESHLRYALVSGGLPRPAVNEPVFSRDGEWPPSRT